MLLLREDLWGALFLAVRTGKLGTLAGAGQVALSLWSHLGPHLLLQLDAFLQSLLLRLAQGSRSAASQHQEAALEVRYRLCKQEQPCDVWHVCIARTAPRESAARELLNASCSDIFEFEELEGLEKPGCHSLIISDIV